MLLKRETLERALEIKASKSVVVDWLHSPQHFLHLQPDEADTGEFRLRVRILGLVSLTLKTVIAKPSTGLLADVQHTGLRIRLHCEWNAEAEAGHEHDISRLRQSITVSGPLWSWIVSHCVARKLLWDDDYEERARAAE